MFAMMPLALALIGAAAQAQTWTPLARNAPAAVDEMNLLTDGTVLVHHADFTTNDGIWYRLTPDINGSYVNGTWSQVASLPSGYGPIDFGSAVLPDGKVIVEGGEYNFGNDVETNLGAIYDPVANKWTAVTAPSGWSTIGDGPSAVLANGTFMLGQSGSATKAAALFNESTLSWTITGNGKFDANAEEGWVLLPNGKVLAVDAYFGQYNATGTNSEIYDPATGNWSYAGSTIVQLWDSAAACGGSSKASYEVGPAALRPDGTVFATGSNQCASGHTAIYNSNTGTWTRGPDFPSNLSAFDAPAATEINGNVIVEVAPGDFGNGAEFFEWNGSTLAQLPEPMDLSQESSYPGKMMNLPNGQILWTHYAADVHVFTPSGSYQAGWQPTITSVATQLTPGSSYAISGTQFNGLTQGSWYGDDAANATNYPIVRLVNSASGHVFYCRTHNHSTMAIATGNQTVSTNFDVPSNVETGAAKLYVVANGIPSSGLSVMVGSSGGTVTLSPTSLSFGNVNVGSTSAAQSVTLHNGTASALSIGSIATSGAFTQTNNCASSLAAGGNCSINVSFKPTASGAASGTLSITDNATNSPQTASLSGTGVATGGSVTLSPSSFNFGNVAVNNYSNWQAFTLSNSGSGAVSISNVAASGPFDVSSTCGSVLAAASNCTIWVLFAPTANGNFSGTLSVTDSAANSPQTSALSGTGGNGGSATLSPGSLSFGNVTVGSTSAAQAVTLKNNSSGSMTVSSVAVNGSFAQSNNCTTLAAGASCTINVTFKPTAAGNASGTLTVTDTATNSPQTASLSGTGVAPTLSLTPSSFNFGSVAVNNYSSWQAFTVSNRGSTTASLGSAQINSNQFDVTSYCGASLPAGSNCTIWVLFAPTQRGALSGTLSVSNNVGNALTSALSGTGQ